MEMENLSGWNPSLRSKIALHVAATPAWELYRALSRSRRAVAADKMVARRRRLRQFGAPPPPLFGLGAARRGTYQR